jgi:CheY-like chemotaxis protein
VLLGGLWYNNARTNESDLGREAIAMMRTYIDRVFEYYQEKDDDFDGEMGEFSLKTGVTGLEMSLNGEGGKMPAKKLLIVDDEANIRHNFFRLFSRRGFDVLTAPGAIEANELLVREKVDVVFLDLKMNEVEGDIFYELLRAFHHNVKVVVSSVYPIEEQKERIKDADAYFDKSDGQDVLLGMVSALVN